MSEYEMVGTHPKIAKHNALVVKVRKLDKRIRDMRKEASEAWQARASWA
jgi:hypothetical protein